MPGLVPADEELLFRQKFPKAPYPAVDVQGCTNAASAGCAGAAFGRIVSVSGLQRSAFPALACKSGACRPWQARSAGRRFTGPSPLSASPYPGPLTGPRFVCPCPRLDRRGDRILQLTRWASDHGRMKCSPAWLACLSIH